MTWHRSNPSTGFRRIADDAGSTVADCPSYTGGPSMEEAQANAELIVSGGDRGRCSPGPWQAVPGCEPYAWLVLGGPRRVIVAMVPARRPDAREIAERIVHCATDARGSGDN